MKKFSGTGHATGNNIIGLMHFTRCLTKAQTNTHTLRISNTYGFSTTIFFTLKHHNVTLYVLCLSCLKMQVNMQIMDPFSRSL